MKSQKISIIVPIYNAEKYLVKCVESIISQTHQNLEIILINDGSKDNSLAICKKFVQDDNRIILISQSNAGVSAARNKGLNIATGDFIGFVDSDDYISPEMYEKLLVAALKENADIIECGYFRTDETYKVLETKALQPELTKGNITCTQNYLLGINTTNFNCNKLYKKHLFNNIRYPDFVYSEDFWVNSKVFFCCHAKSTISDCLYYYVNNQTSVCNQPFNLKHLDMTASGQEIYRFFNTKDVILASYAALYVLKKIIVIYNEIVAQEKTEYTYLADELLIKFRHYYSIINKNPCKKIFFTKQYVLLFLFRINPKLHHHFRQLINRLKVLIQKNWSSQ